TQARKAKGSMDSQILIEVSANGAGSSERTGFLEGLNRTRKGSRADGLQTPDVADGTGMRFAFLIHPLSEQTRDLMALDRDGRLRRTWGQADLLEFCSEAHAAFGSCSRPMPDGCSRG